VGADAFAVGEVERPAHPRKVIPLRFPEDLRKLGLPGEVHTRFVIDASGHALRETLVIVSSTHPAFTRAVRDALRTTVWEPAQIGGIAVPQWVEQPFTFSLSERR
jgi:TonB family protein